MTHETDSDISEVGSFYWYCYIDDKFFTYLTNAIKHADHDNTLSLTNIFPHIMLSHSNSNWDKTRIVESITVAINKKKLGFKLDDVCKPETLSVSSKGSLSYYIIFGGSFVKNLALAILYADNHNIELIRTQYPQMVAAAEMDSLNMCPEGFTSNTYKAIQIP